MMRRSGIFLATLSAVCLFSVLAAAAPLKGTVVVPTNFKPARDRHVTHWRVENGVVPVAPPLRDPRTEMVVFLEGGKAPPLEKTPVAVMEIKGYRFDPFVVVVPAGGTVEFKNTGRVVHVIYDRQKVMSPGTVRPGETRKQRYHAEGEYEIREEEFPHMKGIVKVLSTPLFAVPDETGSFKMDNVPVGRWTVKVWYRGAIIAQTTVDVGEKGSDVVVKVPEQQPQVGK